MKEVVTKVYSFEELSEESKQVAIKVQQESEWYLDYDWYDCVYEEQKEIIKEAGFDVEKIYFSGFHSQGDGAMFEYDGLDKKLRLEFIEQLKLSPMRKEWLRNNTMIGGKGTHRGHYHHEYCCNHSIDWEVDNGDVHWSSNFGAWIDSFQSDFGEYVKDIYVDLCQGLYKALEREYNWLMSDEVVAEHLVASEYEFTEDGKRW